MSEQLDNRYQTVGGIQQDMNAYLSGYVTRAEEGGVLRRAKLYFSRHKYFILVVTLLVIINLAVILLLTLD
jgi:hypothetical protein